MSKSYPGATGISRTGIFADALLCRARPTPVRILEFSATLARTSLRTGFGSFNLAPASFFEAFGAEPIETVTGSIIFDNTAAPLSGPNTLLASDTRLQQTLSILPCASFRVAFGPFSLGQRSGRITNNTFLVRDGNGADVAHAVTVSQSTEQAVGPAGAALTDMNLDLRSSTPENPFDGAASVPDIGVLNALASMRELKLTFTVPADDTGSILEREAIYTVGILKNAVTLCIPEPADAAALGLKPAGLWLSQHRRSGV